MSKLLVQTTALGLLALPLYAQEITYSAASLDYSSISVDGDDASALSNLVLNGEMEYQISQFVLGLEAHNHSFRGDAIFIENFLRWGASAAYSIRPEILVGVDYEAFKLTFEDFEDEASTTSVFAQYENANFGVAINHRMVDADFGQEDFTAFFATGKVGEMFSFGAVVEEVPVVDEFSYHLSADVASGAWSARGFYTSITDADVGYYGLRASYDFGSGLSVNAGYDGSSNDFIAGFSSRSVGADYQVTDAVSVGALYTRYETDFGSDINSFGVSVNYLMGSPKRLDKRMYQDVSDDLRQSPLIEFPDYGFGLLFGFFGAT